MSTQTGTTGRTPAATDHLVEVQHLAKSFGDHEVITVISFTVDPGTVTCVIGPSGSGKTTLLRSLNALEVPDRGVVRIGGTTVDFAGINPGPRGRLPRPQRAELMALRRHSGMVFQAHHLFPHKTALENVIEGPVVVQGESLAEATARARELLDKVGLAEHADKYPFQLSGGQQQRVGIARALAIRPDLVLFDEPTSALDPELVGDVLAVIKELSDEGWTMVIVTHELGFAREVADQVVFMDHGVVVEHGTPDVVLGEPREERTRQFVRRLQNRF